MVYGFLWSWEKFNNIETIQFSKRKTGIPQEELDNKVAAQTGELLHWNHGKSIEPAISPLGYDWKIGIAIISSFGARSLCRYISYYLYG
jgi:ferrous iron transport protein B